MLHVGRFPHLLSVCLRKKTLNSTRFSASVVALAHVSPMVTKGPSSASRPSPAGSDSFLFRAQRYLSARSPFLFDIHRKAMLVGVCVKKPNAVFYERFAEYARHSPD